MGARRRPAGVLGLTIVGNVTISEGDETPLNFTNLGCTRMEPLWLEAQSVPSASLVPCVRSLPAGWTLSEVVVNHGRSVLTFDNDRAGPGVMVVRLTASCDPAGATQVPSNQPGVRRFVLVQDLAPQYSATGFYVFPGGCVTARLAIPAARQAELVSEASAVLGFTTRRTLRQTLEARSGGRLHLDPDTAR